MKSFQAGQRVRIAAAQDERLAGRKGTVWRKLYSSTEAWVKMDEALPDGVRLLFPAEDPGGRGRWLVLWPHECELC